MLDKLNIVQQRFNEISDLIIQPNIISDQKRYIKLNKEYKEFGLIIEKKKLYEELLSDSENTLPTHHNKILIGKVKEYNFKTIEPKITQLIVEAKNQKNDSLVKKMKDIIPEFISQNSDFTKFDT